MVKRRDLIRELQQAGFVNKDGTNHEKFVGPNGRTTFVPRHREISLGMADEIRKQAGIKRKRSS